MSEIQDFWTLDQTTMDKDKIKSKCREYYTEDFINNYAKWRGNVDHMNADIKAGISNIIPPDKYIDITFDQWCGKILELFDNFIEQNTKRTCQRLLKKNSVNLFR